MDEMKGILDDFMIESLDSLNHLDNDLIQLETNPDPAGISNIFRAVHSIKGSAGFVGLSKLQSVAHIGENLLGAIRANKVSVSPEIVTALLQMIDAIRQIINSVQASGKEGDVDYSALIKKLETLCAGGTPIPSAPTVEISTAAEPPREAAKIPPQPDSSIRVNVDLLDHLMNLVGELVLVRNQILQGAGAARSGENSGAYQRLNLITSDLQEGIMKTRMQAVDQILSKFPRVVRDLAATCQKKIRLEIEGKETELDRSVIEAIKDPMTHLIRNAVDHGVETPEVRLQRGKSEEGLLKIMAYHEGGLVNIDISDDGGGIDSVKVKKKAVEKGLITSDQALALSDRESVNLVFLPGFSTAEKVSNVSGRGVGMDVVKTNIEAIGGAVEVETKPGKGSTFKLKIPLTLAIIPALIVESAKNRYAIPMSSLVELLRLNHENDRIEDVHGAPVFRLRGQLLPILFLEKELNRDPDFIYEKPSVNVVVLQAGDQPFGLVVDRIHDSQEVVVKPLGRQLKGIAVFSGATILGDGKVASILDVLNLAKRASVISETQSREGKQLNHEFEAETADSTRMMVITKSPGNGRLAIPFESVQRLEQFYRDKTERIGDRDVIQYRGRIMPLLNVSYFLPERRTEKRPAGADNFPVSDEKIDVVVFSDDNGSYGLIVEKIIDIIEQDVGTMTAPGRHGISGCFILQDRVTEMLDVAYILKKAAFSLEQEEA